MKLDIHAAGIWAVLNPNGELVPGTADASGYSARSNMVREHQLIWSHRANAGYVLARMVPRVVREKPLAVPVQRVGVTGAVFTYSQPDHAEVNSVVKKGDSSPEAAAQRTLEAVELALTAAGFDITNSDLREVLQTAHDSVMNDL